jgi:hypothetical protein
MVERTKFSEREDNLEVQLGNRIDEIKDLKLLSRN